MTILRILFVVVSLALIARVAADDDGREAEREAMKVYQVRRIVRSRSFFLGML